MPVIRGDKGKVTGLEGLTNQSILFLDVIPDVDIGVPYVKYRSTKKNVPTDPEEIVKEFKRRASYQLAKKAQEILVKWLEVDGQYNIGFTGKSAENIKVSKHAVISGDSLVHYVYEEPETPNRYIRYGLDPDSSSSEHVSFEKKKEWVDFRGLEYLGKSARRDEEEEKEAIVYAVWKSIYENGTSSYYETQDFTNHRRYFNYPQKLNDDARPDLIDRWNEIIAGETGSDIQGNMEAFIINSLSSAYSQPNKPKSRWGGGYDTPVSHVRPKKKR